LSATPQPAGGVETRRDPDGGATSFPDAVTTGICRPDSYCVVDWERLPGAVARARNSRQTCGAKRERANLWGDLVDRSTICVSAQLDRQPESAEFEAAAGVLKLLADATRLRIIWALLHGEHSVNELADHVGARPPAVSQHLSRLRLAHLVRVRRDGNRVFYALENGHIERLAAEALQHADHVVAGGLHHGSAPE
jgi:DNA-binding transcriptional ArsR family regulator